MQESSKGVTTAIPRRLGYREGSALLAIGLHALAAGLYLRGAGALKAPDDWTGQYFFLLCASLCCSLAGPRLGKRTVQALLLGFQAFLLAVADYPEGASVALACVFACVLLLGAVSGPGLSIPLVPLISASAIALFRVRPLRAWTEAPSVPAVADSLLAGAVAVGFAYVCLGARAWEAEARRQGERVASRDRSIASLLSANLDFQNYALEAGERSTMAERKRLSRDIHDIVGYTLINLRMMLEAAIDYACGNERLAQLLAEARDQTQGGLTETRRVLRSFREMENAKPEGIASIQKIVSSFTRATGIAVEVNYGNIPWTLGSLNSIISHIVQEGITNAIRHGGATSIQISFWIVRDRVHVKVSDNGAGAPEVKPGIGLEGMRERLEPIGGELLVQSSEYGFSLIAEMPLPEGLRAGTAV